MMMKICGVGLQCIFKNFKIYVSVLLLKTYCVCVCVCGGGGGGRMVDK